MGSFTKVTCYTVDIWISELSCRWTIWEEDFKKNSTLPTFMIAMVLCQLYIS